MKIGYAITTTPKRFDFMEEADLFALCERDSVCYLHNDVAGIGTATAKNRCIKFLYDAGCDYIILMDDDTRILREDLGQHLIAKYHETGIPHFIYPGKGAAALRTMQCGLTEWSLGSGVMLFVTRNVIDTVGYMNVNYGQWGHEHVAWSMRIQKAGLMGCRSWRISPSDIRKYFYAYDIDGVPMVENFTPTEKDHFRRANMPEYVRETKGQRLYYPFRIREEAAAV